MSQQRKRQNFHSPMPKPLSLLLLLLLLSVGGVSSGDGTFCAAADSLDRLSEFFARNANGLDADGYFGLSLASIVLDSESPRMLAARLGDCADGRLVDLQRTMYRVHKVLRSFRSRSESSRSAYDRSTYRQICRPMESVMRRMISPTRFHWRRFADKGKEGKGAGNLAAIRKSLYRENAGDECFRGILAQKRGHRCSISPTCRRYFLNSRPTKDYTLTHQIMYWTAAIDLSCHLKLSNGRPVDRSLLTNGCRRAYEEQKAILSAGQAGYSQLDLAIEQAVLCGFLGYRDFFADTTTLMLRRLQDERRGCFDEKIVAPTDSSKEAHGRRTSTGRKLLHNVVLDGVCSSHTSGLAAAYFAFVLRT